MQGRAGAESSSIVEDVLVCETFAQFSLSQAMCPQCRAKSQLAHSQTLMHGHT